jgi:hypothetical protein
MTGAVALLAGTDEPSAAVYQACSLVRRSRHAPTRVALASPQPEQHDALTASRVSGLQGHTCTAPIIGTARASVTRMATPVRTESGEVRLEECVARSISITRTRVPTMLLREP